MAQTAFHEYVMAVDRVEKRLKKVTAALDAAELPYAVIGGNAVAAWVARVDPSATRSTKDVDLLVRRQDMDRITDVMKRLGFQREDLRSLILFIDPDEPSRRSGVHLVWADENVRPSYTCPAPSVDETERDPSGFAVISLEALSRMKLTSFRDIDRVHIRDLIEVGLLGEHIVQSLPKDLRGRLEEIQKSIED